MKDNKINVFTTDGEAIILEEELNEHVISLFGKANTDIIKLGASRSSSDQPWDVSVCFRETKRCIKDVLRKGADYSNEEVSECLSEHFNELNAKYKISISAFHRQHAIKGCLVISYCLKNYKCFSEQNIRNGFLLSGMHSKDKEYTIDKDRILNHCTTAWKDGEIENIIQHIDVLADELLTTGRVSDATLDRIGAPKSPEQGPASRDALPLHRQRPIVVSHPNTSEWHRKKNMDNAIQKNLHSSKGVNEIDITKMSPEFAKQIISKNEEEQQFAREKRQAQAIQETRHEPRVAFGTGRLALDVQPLRIALTFGRGRCHHHGTRHAPVFGG